MITNITSFIIDDSWIKTLCTDFYILEKSVTESVYNIMDKGQYIF